MMLFHDFFNNFLLHIEMVFREDSLRYEGLGNPDSSTNAASQSGPFKHNSYATKKTLVHGAYNVALLINNALQLKHVLAQGDQDDLYIPELVLICISIGLQVCKSLFENDKYEI